MKLPSREPKSSSNIHFQQALDEVPPPRARMSCACAITACRLLYFSVNKVQSMKKKKKKGKKGTTQFRSQHACTISLFSNRGRGEGKNKRTGKEISLSSFKQSQSEDRLL